jgi:hypothetical protein
LVVVQAVSTNHTANAAKRSEGRPDWQILESMRRPVLYFGPSG